MRPSGYEGGSGLAVRHDAPGPFGDVGIDPISAQQRRAACPGRDSGRPAAKRSRGGHGAVAENRGRPPASAGNLVSDERIEHCFGTKTNLDKAGLI